MINLTEKEIRFIELKSQGLKMWQIASHLYVSLSIAEKMANELHQKTGCSNGSSLVSWAYQNGILKINKEILPMQERKAG